MNPVFQFLNGKRYTLNGVSGVFKHEIREARYPYPHQYEKLSHNPDARGRRSEYYLDRKHELKDDWSTDLSQSIDTYCEIAIRLGYREWIQANAKDVLGD